MEIVSERQDDLDMRSETMSSADYIKACDNNRSIHKIYAEQECDCCSESEDEEEVGVWILKVRNINGEIDDYLWWKEGNEIFLIKNAIEADLNDSVGYIENKDITKMNRPFNTYYYCDFNKIIWY